jgi:DUF1680 family protein
MTALGASTPLFLGSALAELAELGPGRTSPRQVQPFALSAVRLHPGMALDALEVNRRNLMGLDPERLLHMFRITAGLPSAAAPLGGWEAPNNELRGHFTGHYLSACAMMSAHTGEAAIRERGIYVSSELAKCQAAIGNGYLSAFPEDLFDRLRAGQPAWAPFYTLHKIMAGLLDTHTLSGDPQALATVLGMAQWTQRWVQPLNDDHMARVLEREYGGMNEVLYNLAAVTGDTRWRELAHRFDRERIFGPLALGHDELQGLHANTTIPQVIGAARGYELTGSVHLHDVAQNFWHMVAERRTYCTGGTSNGESWNTPPGVLAAELSGYTEESCVTYNMRKLTRHVYGWTADARMADYLERTFYNGILGVQSPRDGDKLYYLPLQGGYWKLFGIPLQDFWCCTGSMAESFASLGDGIYFRDEQGVYVNLYVASELNWADRGMRLVQETRFPEEETVQLVIHVERPTRLALRLRVPYWTSGARAWLNDKPLDGFAEPSGYFTLTRTWAQGDRVKIRLPMRLHAAPMPDDETLQAVMYGPIVLAGRLGTEGLTAANLRAPPTKPRTVPEYPAEPVPVPEILARTADPASWVAPVPGRALEFVTLGQAQELSLVPLYRIMDERFAVYFRVRAPSGA